MANCPSCQAPLTPREAEGVRCPSCGASFQGGRGAPMATAAEPAPYGPPERRPAPVVRSGGGKFSLFLSFLALIIAVYVLVHVMFNDPLKVTLWRYDFSTAKGTMQSLAKMEANGDIQAMIAYRARSGDSEVERAKTLVVEEEVDWDKGKIVFYKYQRKGKNIYATEGFVKDEKTGYWTQKSVDTSKVKEDLAKKISDWRAKSDKLGPDDF